MEILTNITDFAGVPISINNFSLAIGTKIYNKIIYYEQYYYQNVILFGTDVKNKEMYMFF